GRSQWESLKARLQQWSTDPSKALALTPSQREDLRKLIKAMRTKETKTMHDVEVARHKLDEAESVGDLHKIRTDIMSSLNRPDEGDDDAGAGGAAPKPTLRWVNGTLVPVP